MDEERHKSGPASAGEDALQAEIVARLRQQLALLREQVRRMHDALHKTENLRTSARDRLNSLRDTSEKLEQALRMEEAARGESNSTSLAHHTPLADVLSWQPVARADCPQIDREVVVKLSDRHVHALMVSGLLSIGDMDDRRKVGRVVQNLLDRWSEHYRDDQPLRSDASSGASSGTNARERRSGRERRGKQPRANSLLSYVYQTTLDRRARAERRHDASETQTSESRGDPHLEVTEPNVVSLEVMRTLMRDGQKTAEGTFKKHNTKHLDDSCEADKPPKRLHSDALDDTSSAEAGSADLGVKTEPASDVRAADKRRPGADSGRKTEDKI